VNRKRRSLAPYSKLRRAYSWTSLRELIPDNGSSRAPNFCCPPNARETKRELREARSGYHITCPRGILGNRRMRTETEREQLNAGEFPKTYVDAERERTLISRIPLNSNIQLSLFLAQHFLFETLLLVLEQIFIYDQISQISFFLYNARSFEYFFFLCTNLIIYIEIWQLLSAILHSYFLFYRTDCGW
jgi:hypothetical protein